MVLARAVKGISFASVADTYTLNLFTPEESEKAGYGYLTAKLAKTGRARVKGVMPDAKSLSVSVYPIRATLNELTDAGLPVTAFTGFSAYGGDETLYLLPVFVKKAKQKFYALGAVGGNSASDRLWLEKAEYTGVSHWTLTASGYPFRKKQTGTFAGKALSVYRGDTLLFGDIPVTANFALSGAPASCSLKAVASGGVFSVKFRDGKKSVSAKAAAVTRDGTATGVGKSGKTLYYVMVE